MAEYAFTFVQVAIGGEQGYVAFPFVLESDGQSLCVDSTCAASRAHR
jgi:hypothetical protein